MAPLDPAAIAIKPKCNRFHNREPDNELRSKKRGSFRHFLSVSSAFILMAPIGLAQTSNNIIAYDGTVSTDCTTPPVAGTADPEDRDQNVIVGGEHCMQPSSSQNLVVGTGNEVGNTGLRNVLVGTNNKVGNTNTFNLVVGANNTMQELTSDSLIVGKDNNIGGLSFDSIIIGQQNTLRSGQVSYIKGSDNFVGIDTVGLRIFGDGNDILQNQISQQFNLTDLTVMGSHNRVLSTGNTAVNGSDSIIIGSYNEINGAGSGSKRNIVLGSQNTVSGSNNFVASNAAASGSFNVVIGDGANSSGEHAVAIGSGSIASMNRLAAQDAYSGGVISGVMFLEGRDAIGGEFAIGDRILTGLADGRIEQGSGDAINGHQLQTFLTAVDTRIITNKNRISDAGDDIFDLDTKTLINAIHIARNENDIATLQTSVAHNLVTIGDNIANIASNTANVATNTSNIATNTAGIGTNTAAISAHTSQLQQHDTRIAENTGQISANTTSIGESAANIASNTANVATNTSNIATNTAGIGTNTAAISAQTNQLKQHNSGISDNAGQIATNTLAIVENTNAIDSNSNTVQDLSLRLTQTESQRQKDIASMQEKAASDRISIATNTADISSMRTDVDNNTSKTDANAQSISSLNQLTRDNGARLALAEAQAANHNLQIRENTTEIASLIGITTANTNEIGINKAAIARNSEAIGQTLAAIEQLRSGSAALASIPDLYLNANETWSIAGGLATYDDGYGGAETSFGGGLQYRRSTSDRWSIGVAGAVSGDVTILRVQGRIGR